MKLKQNNSVETEVLTKMEKKILDRKKCRRRQLDVEELGNGKEAELCVLLNDSSTTHTHTHTHAHAHTHILFY